MQPQNMSPSDRSLSLSNLQDPEVRANPYPLYHRIRSHEPVHWDEPMGFWTLTGYADIVSTLRDKRIRKGQGIAAAKERVPEEAKESAQSVFDTFSKTIVYSDPPSHTRMRGLVNKAFTPRMVMRMESHIKEIVERLLDAVQQKGRMDLIADLAYPLPFTVIMEMLGLPGEDRQRFKKWSDDFAAVLGMVRHRPEKFHAARGSIGEVTEYICGMRQSLVAEPKDDLLSALATAAEAGDRLTNEELVANALMLLAAGHETTTKLISNGLLALMRHPEQMKKLRDEPALMASAIDELLRYDSPVQIVWRYADEDMEIGGKPVQRGKFLNLVIGAANRDPARFSEPDRLDITRADNDHLAFGGGIHFCPGAALARLEGQIAIGAILRRMPNLRLETETLEWQESPTFRGAVSFPVSF
ncbi:MAG TPA: cytochrome P450 [Vicinamibacteria bacterium]